MLRAIFRFGVFGYLINALIVLEKKDLEKVLKTLGKEAEKYSALYVMNLAASLKLVNGTKRVYGFPAKFFLGLKFHETATPTYKGVIWLVFFSLLATILILLILW